MAIEYLLVVNICRYFYDNNSVRVSTRFFLSILHFILGLHFW